MPSSKPSKSTMAKKSHRLPLRTKSKGPGTSSKDTPVAALETSDSKAVAAKGKNTSPPYKTAPSKASKSTIGKNSNRLALRTRSRGVRFFSKDTPVDTPETSKTNTVSTKSRNSISTSTNASDSSSSIEFIRRTSTEEFGHVPFDKFSLQVKKLCEQLWPSSAKLIGVDRLMGGHGDRFRLVLRGKRFDRSLKATATSNDFIIERLRGGSFNRVVGITVMHSNGDKATHVVLRVPRWWDAEQESEVAILRFVSRYTSIPVPVIQRVDSTKDNPLKERYVLQSRIYGNDLQNINKPFYYPTLTHEQKCIVARELAKLILSLHSINHPHPGMIESPPEGKEDEPFIIRPFKIENMEGEGFEAEEGLNTTFPLLQNHVYDPTYKPIVKEGPITPEGEREFVSSTSYFMMTQLGRMRAAELLHCPARIGWVKEYEKLGTAVSEMSQLFQLGNDVNCLCHLDFIQAPRNIMVDMEKDGPLEVKAVLDWDSACFGPQFVGCEPPMWLWNWNEDDYEDEKLANDVPPTPEGCEIKKIFEEAISKDFPMWYEYAYRPEYRLARTLFRFAIDGVRVKDELEEFFEEWDPLCKEMMAKMKAEKNGPDSGGETGETSQKGDKDKSSPNESNEDIRVLEEGLKKAQIAEERGS